MNNINYSFNNNYKIVYKFVIIILIANYYFEHIIILIMNILIYILFYVISILKWTATLGYAWLFNYEYRNWIFSFKKSKN